MANRRDFFYRQKVTEAELDAAFNELEQAERYITSDLGLIGVAVGYVVAQQASPNLTVQVSGPGVVYDQMGQRVAIPSTQNVNCAVDEGALSTAVIGGANSRILSIFVEFDRTLTDPRTDGNSATVYFDRAEGFQFNVVAGVEGVSPVAPPLRSDQILLGDILLVFGQVAILTADVSSARREWMFSTVTGTAVAAGTVEEAIQTLADAAGTSTAGLAAHLIDTVDAHDASAISNVAAGGIVATTVQAAIDELDTEKMPKTGGAFSGGITVPAANEFAYASARTVTVRLNNGLARPNRVGVAGDWQMNGDTSWLNSGAGDATEFKLFHPLAGQIPRGCQFDQIEVDLDQTDASGSTFDIGYYTSGGTGLVWTSVSASGAIANSGGINTAPLSFTAHTMLDTKQYFVRIRSDAGQASGLTIYEVRVRCLVTDIKT